MCAQHVRIKKKNNINKSSKTVTTDEDEIMTMFSLWYMEAKQYP